MVFVTIRRVFCLEVSGCQCVRVKITDSGGDEPATNLTAAMEVTTITGSGDLGLVLRQVPLFSGQGSFRSALVSGQSTTRFGFVTRSTESTQLAQRVNSAGQPG
ncbi:hypothetical protein HanPI659440_Chr09g0327071 [Helianthus annuus]|nr:hypothetical protein HanPI659440_Chr09g0327071 [Helianthus annuus]